MTTERRKDGRPWRVGPLDLADIRMVAELHAPLLTSKPCLHHVHGTPRPVLNHRHHIHPLGMGGSDESGNITIACPTLHTNVHVLLEAYKREGQRPSWMVRKLFGPAERKLAAQGWARHVEGNLDGGNS